MRTTPKTYTVNEALLKLEQYCAYQERCHKEVTQKLEAMGMIPLAIDHIISELIANRFLDETRFACAFARGKFRQKYWGRMRISRELKLRQISDYNIKLALKELTDEEYMLVLDTLSRKRINTLKPTEDIYKRRKKLIDYLLYRGWESDLVFEKAKELIF